MENTITTQFGPVFEELIHLIGSFRDDTFNARPSTGGWTAGQTAQHIRLSAGNISGLLNGATEPTERDPEEKVDAIRNLFMDFDNKMQSPEFIVPEDRPYDRNDLIVSFRQLIDAVEHDIEDLDLTETCVGFELPGFGRLTRLEWMAFVLYHTQRHIHQIRNISQKI